MIRYPLPLLGFSAFSGTGKTTLLTRLLPLLRAEGVRVGVIKHAHHSFDVDHPGKDSHVLREAGAEQMLIASRNRMALIREFREPRDEPTLSETLDMLSPEHIDLVLVEGFKREQFPKIELHRPMLGKPLLYPDDPDIIAIASDRPLTQTRLPQLDLYQPHEIASFILEQIMHHCGSSQSAKLTTEESLAC
ncbi:MAG TPA: molybdopterin-guanine dinucleotide biosynthesis protein B [Chromatiales bacterium]|nr:molybdopterin-guanine dinucleotide biosynthesis protein B [Chromatiales bacterium]